MFSLVLVRILIVGTHLLDVSIASVVLVGAPHFQHGAPSVRRWPGQINAKITQNRSKKWTLLPPRSKIRMI